MQYELGLDAEIRCGQVESWAAEHGHLLIVGLDEAGRGPLAGPVVAGAVALPRDLVLDGLDDSKKLSAKVRDRLFDRIRSEAIAYGVAAIEPDEIDRINIRQASLKAMGVAWTRAVDGCAELRDALAVVDGKDRAHLPADVEQRPIVKGDARSLTIAAASILAKVTRDRRMLEYHARWPEYGFDRHKGYPTRAHREAIAAHGPTAIHRRTFRLLAAKP